MVWETRLRVGRGGGSKKGERKGRGAGGAGREGQRENPARGDGVKQGGRHGGASEMELRFWGNVPSVQGAKQKA